MKSNKVFSLAVSVVVIAIMFSSCASNKAVSNEVAQQAQQGQEQPYQIKNLVGIPLDYSDKSNWMEQEQNPTHEADLIFIFPTVAMKSQDDSGICTYDESYKKIARSPFKKFGSAFAPYTNVYVPYYRQATMEKAFTLATQEEYIKFITETVIRADVYAALDYYFKNLNNGRPYILAGHSQGSAIIRMILADYMKAHPEYLKQMVATYVIGFSITKDYLKANPQLKFAQGETDTNVIISYNVEGPDGTLPNIVIGEGAIAINPLNWKLDETPATVEENKGSFDMKTLKLVKGYGDATLNTKRGVVVCTTEKNYIPYNSSMTIFGNKSLHEYDYPLYYINLRENGKKRIDAFLGHEAK